MKWLIPLVLAGSVIHSAPTLAQASSLGMGPSPGLAKNKNDNKVRERAPPALPGARAEPEAVAPADRAAADLPPTEALFDAINRGDLPTVKDAVARGADINGHNVLGLTPLELSVDLGRNNISFLLLSLRGGSGYSVAGAPGGAAPAPTSRTERQAALRAERDANRESRRQATARPATAPSAQTARLFANNGGASVPQSGFLGFDSSR